MDRDCRTVKPNSPDDHSTVSAGRVDPCYGYPPHLPMQEVRPILQSCALEGDVEYVSRYRMSALSA